jgi:hypothetical protein
MIKVKSNGNKTSLQRLSGSWKDNIKMDLMEVSCGDGDELCVSKQNFFRR